MLFTNHQIIACKPKPHGSTLDKHYIFPARDIIETTSIQFSKNKKNEVMKKARREQFLEIQKAYRDGDTPVPNTEWIIWHIMETRVNPKPSRLFRQMLKCKTIQASAIENLWSARSTSISASVELLLPLANPQGFCVWYPQPVKPTSVGMICESCKLNLATRKKRDLVTRPPVLAQRLWLAWRNQTKGPHSVPTWMP